MTLGLTQPLTEMSTRIVSWGGGRRLVRRADNLTESGILNLLEPSGPVQACNGIAFFCYCCLEHGDGMFHRNVGLTSHSTAVSNWHWLYASHF